jgi:hypothetical protein
MKNRCWNIKWIRVPFIWIVVSFISLYATTLFAGQVTLAWDAADKPVVRRLPPFYANPKPGL